MGAAVVAGLAGLMLVTLFGVAAATAPAGNRSPVPGLVEFPGPEEVSFGENVAYTASLLNNQSSNFSHVQYRHKVPTTGPGATATLIYASCDPNRTSWVPDADGFYTCPEISQVPAGTTAKVVLVFRTPGTSDGVGDNVTCSTATKNCLLTSNGYWLIKEGTGKPGSSGPDTFPPLDGPPLTVTTDLLGAAPDLTKARGFILDECTTGTSLETSVSVPVGPNNKLQTEICATSVPNQLLHPGLLVHLDESATAPLPPGLEKRITEVAFVCMPAPPSTSPPNSGVCPSTPGYFNPGYLPWVFEDNATFKFTIDNRSLPSGEKIDVIRHNGAILLDCDDPAAEPTCVVDIDVNNQLKVTVVIAEGPTQGGWDFG